MRLSIRTNFPEVEAALRNLRQDVRDRVTARALNRSIEQARTQMVREITSEYAVKAAQVRDRLRIKRATFKAGALGLEAALESPQGRGRAQNVIRFSARQTAQGVTVKIKKKEPRKLIRGVFIANKGRTVFERVPGTKMRSRRWGKQHGQQVRPVQTIDVPQMFNTNRIAMAVTAALQGRFPAIFSRELAWAMTQFNR